MPWRETTPMRERGRFIVNYESGLYTMSELCERFGVSRKTGYKWVARYGGEGLAGLADRSRAPHHCPHRTEARLIDALVRARRQHPTWGPRKPMSWLAKHHPESTWPAPSTAGDILKQAGLIEARTRRRRLAHPGKTRVPMAAPNDVWSTDFKGEFRAGDGQWCYPLTVADGASRYLLACAGKRSVREAGVRPVFVRLFQDFGLPKAMLSDNGPPFASNGRARLSKLSVWWIKLGIELIRIEPGHPEQNGRHERMHRTLKAETTRPPAANLPAQQRLFDRFQREYNTERPHEALGQLTPVEVYRPSPRAYPARLPAIEYPGHYEVRRVTHNGCMFWQRDYLFVTRVLTNEYIGLEEIDEGVWSVYFGPLLLGRFDERERRIYS